MVGRGGKFLIVFKFRKKLFFYCYAPTSINCCLNFYLLSENAQVDGEYFILLLKLMTKITQFTCKAYIENQNIFPNFSTIP